ncbi:MAG: 1-acyl-sn-glycerol-3-phosphate acyltransferase [Deltaproteobacteria bacterium]|nr:1-acyl-sn-glycerol-3-phosphate acyltransferase [Deltaproteobacteria bacterium]
MIVLRFLRTVIGIPLIFAYMCVCATVIFIAGERELSEKALRHWCRFCLIIAGARVDAQQQVQFDHKQSFVFISNHTSHLDVPAIITTTPVPLRFIAKKELSYIPFFGQAARRMGHVFIDRKDTKGAARAIKARIDKGLGGVALFFFPEGTRATTSELLPFKKGAAIAAIETQLQVVPIGVAGARAVLPPKGLALFEPGPIAVNYGAPLSVQGYTLDTRDGLVVEQRRAVEECVAAAARRLS